MRVWWGKDIDRSWAGNERYLLPNQRDIESTCYRQYDGEHPRLEITQTLADAVQMDWNISLLQGLTLAMCPLARTHFLGGRASSGHNNWFSTGPVGQYFFFFFIFFFFLFFFFYFFFFIFFFFRITIHIWKMLRGWLLNNLIIGLCANCRFMQIVFRRASLVLR